MIIQLKFSSCLPDHSYLPQALLVFSSLEIIKLVVVLYYVNIAKLNLCFLQALLLYDFWLYLVPREIFNEIWNKVKQQLLRSEYWYSVPDTTAAYEHWH